MANVPLTSFNAAEAQNSSAYSWDEVEHYNTMRMLTPPEGAAKILGIPVWTKSCAVETLPVLSRPGDFIF